MAAAEDTKQKSSGRPNPVITVQRRDKQAGKRGMASAALDARARYKDADDHVAIASLVENPNNPRRKLTEIDQLAEDMRHHGVLQPLLVARAGAFLADRPQLADQLGDAEFVILAGHRRIAAARQAELTDIPIYIRDDLASPGAAAGVSRAENLYRVGITPYEEALQMGELRDVDKMSERQIAKAMGCSASHVHKRLQLLKLPEQGIEALESDRIDLQAAAAIAAAPADVQEHVLARVAEDYVTDDIGTVGGEVADRLIAESTLEMARKATTARLEAEGTPVIAWITDESHDIITDPEDISRARAEGTLRAEVPYSGGDPIYVRERPAPQPSHTAPTRHNDDTTTPPPPRVDPEQDAWEKARADRHDLIKGVLTKPLSRDDKHLATLAALRSVTTAPIPRALRLLREWIGDRWGNPIVGEWTASMDEHHLFHAALGYHLAVHESTTDRHGFIFGHQAGPTDARPDDLMVGGSRQPPTEHYQWLQSHGYQPADIEERMLTTWTEFHQTTSNRSTEGE